MAEDVGGGGLQADVDKAADAALVVLSFDAVERVVGGAGVIDRSAAVVRAADAIDVALGIVLGVFEYGAAVEADGLGAQFAVEFVEISGHRRCAGFAGGDGVSSQVSGQRGTAIHAPYSTIICHSSIRVGTEFVPTLPGLIYA